MTDAERPFIENILAAPDDDAPRLVYADWLLARGDARGELIVLQCAIAKAPAWPELKRLRSLVGNVMKKHQRAWLKGPRAAYDGKFYFRRGLVEHLRLMRQEPLAPALAKLREAAPLLRGFSLPHEQLPALAGAAWVEELALERGALTAGLADHLRLPRLRRLSVPPTHWEPGDLAAVAQLEVEALVVGFDRLWQVDEPLRRALGSGLATVRELELTGARRIGPLDLPRVEALKLVRCDMGQESLLAMVAPLKRLELEETDSGVGALRLEPAQLLAAAPQLEDLELAGLAIDSGTLARLLDVPGVARLKRLSLPKNRISTLGVNALIGCEALSGLRQLNLFENRIDVEGARRLREHFPNTEVLVR